MAKLDLAFSAFKANAVGRMLRKALQKTLRDYRRRTAPLAYHDILVPQFDFGAKRKILYHGHLGILHDPRVQLLQSSSLAMLGSQKLRTEDGAAFPADVVILANGFKIQELLFPMTIAGRDGAELPELGAGKEACASVHGVCVIFYQALLELAASHELTVPL